MEDETMSPRVFDQNNPEFCYCKEIKDICEPIIKHFNINYFSYIKLNWNNTMFHLSNRSDWGKFCYDNQLFTRVKNLPDFRRYDIVFTDEIDKESVSLINLIDSMAKYFNICHLAIYVKRNIGSSEIFIFGVPHDQYDFNRKFLVHFDFFKKFIRYFKDRARKMIRHAKQHCFPIPVEGKLFGEQPDFFLPIKERDVINACSLSLTPRRYYLEGEFDDVYLTQREVDCLCLLQANIPYKKIAANLNLSIHTVHDHLNNVKRKLNAPNKATLLKIMNESNIIEMICDDLNACLKKAAPIKTHTNLVEQVNKSLG